MRIFLAILLGIILGIVAAKVLFVGSFLTLLPWGLAGIGIGWFTRTKKEALISGAIYGFVVSFVFLLAGYAGARSIIGVVPFFALLGLFGAVCGIILTVLGFFLRKLLHLSSRT